LIFDSLFFANIAAKHQKIAAANVKIRIGAAKLKIECCN
jgi:hypothetical protein